MGTRFMATKEAPILDGVKEALVKAKVTDTTHIFRTMGNTERVYKNDIAMKVRAIEKESPGEFDKIVHLVKGENYRVSFQETGDADSSVWSCGQSIGLVDEVLSCEDFMAKVCREAEDIIRDRMAATLSKL